TSECPHRSAASAGSYPGYSRRRSGPFSGERRRRKAPSARRHTENEKENERFPNEHLSRNASKCQPTSPLLPKSGLSRARLRNFAAWQVTDRTKKPAFSKYRLLATGCSRSASQTAQERQLGNE